MPASTLHFLPLALVELPFAQALDSLRIYRVVIVARSEVLPSQQVCPQPNSLEALAKRNDHTIRQTGLGSRLIVFPLSYCKASTHSNLLPSP